MVPKGYRAPGILAKKMFGSKVPRQKYWGSRSPGSYFRAPLCSQKRNFCLSSQLKTSSGFGLQGKTFEASGLHPYPAPLPGGNINLKSHRTHLHRWKMEMASSLTKSGGLFKVFFLLLNENANLAGFLKRWLLKSWPFSPERLSNQDFITPIILKTTRKRKKNGRKRGEEKIQDSSCS